MKLRLVPGAGAMNRRCNGVKVPPRVMVGGIDARGVESKAA
jgi:hypothetical protein